MSGGGRQTVATGLRLPSRSRARRTHGSILPELRAKCFRHAPSGLRARLVAAPDEVCAYWVVARLRKTQKCQVTPIDVLRRSQDSDERGTCSYVRERRLCCVTLKHNLRNVLLDIEDQAEKYSLH